MSIKTIFAKNLRNIMYQNKINQSDICSALNVSSSTVSDWCNGKKSPRLEKVEQLAVLLNVDYIEFFINKGE